MGGVENFGLPLPLIAMVRGVFAHYPQVTEVLLYGSRAKGSFHNGPDIDLSLSSRATTPH